jgi:outer membrane lipoprotein-sorting protein
MGRRLFLLVACAALAAGCLGRDASRAEALLQRAAATQEHLASAAIQARFTIKSDRDHAAMFMDGAGYLSGPWAGDGYFRLHLTGHVEEGVRTIAIVRRGDVVTMRVNGRRQRLTVASAESEVGSGLVDFTEFAGLAKYVKHVSVDEVTFHGRPVDRIFGTLDARAMLRTVGFGAQALAGVKADVGDIHANIFIPRDTHLIEAMFIDLDVTVNSHRAHMRFAVAFNRINQRVVFPRI